MRGNPQVYPQVGKDPPNPVTVFGLLAELSDLRAENRKLRRRVNELDAGRARWRTEARAWKWGALRCARTP